MTRVRKITPSPSVTRDIVPFPLARRSDLVWKTAYTLAVINPKRVPTYWRKTISQQQRLLEGQGGAGGDGR